MDSTLERLHGEAQLALGRLVDEVKTKARDNSDEVKTGLAAAVLETRDSCHRQPMMCWTVWARWKNSCTMIL